MTQRAEIRRNPPDILITNYKMLDLLLQRADDLPMWKDAELAYVVVDEFHTYDGAQGTDVAMLLRRLASATGHSRPGRPLGDICPVATSATLGEGGDSPGGDRSSIREVAEQVFGTVFPEGAVIGEDRLTAEEFVGEIDVTLPLPDAQELALLPDPLRDPGAMDLIAAAVTGKNGLSPQELGGVLKQHILTQAVLDLLSGGPATPRRCSSSCRAGAPTTGVRPSASRPTRPPPRWRGSWRCCRTPAIRRIRSGRSCTSSPTSGCGPCRGCSGSPTTLRLSPGSASCPCWTPTRRST
ncbi:hypothetical protein ACFQX6_55290 [Streptosporangium lutulentum]